KLKDLGLVFDGLGIQLFTEGTKSSVIWVAAPGQISEPALIQLPFYEHEFEDSLYIKDIWSAKQAGVDIINKTYSFDEKNKFFSYVARYNELPLSATEFHRSAPSYTATVAMEKNSALVVDNWSGKVVSTEELNLIKRLAKVFEQAYTRFLDLQKAEAQAREAQIEAALEKVRSTSLAMHHSDELENVVAVLFDKLEELGVVFDGALIYTFDRVKRSMDCWVAAHVLEAPVKISLPFSDDFSKNQVAKDLWRAIENGEHYLNKAYSGKAKDDYSLHVIQYNRDKVPEDVSNLMLAANNWTVTFAAEKNSVIGFDSWSGHLTSEVDFELLKRFSRVFEQAYVRFLDLQKAEAAAREAQIEGAMEKIRSRSLAMHHSDELKEVVGIMFKKLDELKVQHGTVAIQLFDFKTKDSIFWPGNKLSDEPPKILLPYDEEMMNADTCHRDLWQAMTKGEIIFNKVYSKDKKDRWFNYVFAHNDLVTVPEKDRDFILSSEIHTVCFIPEKRSAVFADSWDGTLYSEADFEVLKRASRVFEQAYTRFLDLQKAEAQAREAQIEAALERVRSRTMAMHKSEELLEVITVVCEQLQHVGLKFGTVSFGKNSSSFDMDFWVAAPDLETPIKIYAPYRDLSIYIRLKSAHRGKRNFFTDTFDADEIKAWYQHVIDHNPEMFSQKSREYLLSRTAMTRTVVILKNVFLFLINHDIVNYSNEENEILIRFANVFEQAYTRFLDLQKAEEQAREAQIEAALERLRARTMAMQRSTELAEVSQLLHQQFLSLGVQMITCAFMFPNEEKKTQSGWTVLPDGTLVPQLLDFPLVGDEILNERYDSWKEKKPLHRKKLESEENRRHHQFLSEQVASHISKDIFTKLPDKLTFTNANFAQGYLMTFTTSPLTGEEESILVRFAKTFEQTYTRFLDLQKAEAQARESQIQLALERVRARTMAMHVSSEVHDVAWTISDQLHQLGIEGNCTIALINGETGDMEWWTGGFEGQAVMKSYFIQNFDHSIHRAIVDGFKRGERYKSIH
ncbi:MAG TPA: hypothetical protein VF141_07610, partial [Chryseolinea sp.]